VLFRSREGGVLNWYSGPICVNSGFTFSFTLIVNEMAPAHCPGAGVKVYVVVPAVAVLMVSGDQDPEMPFDEVLGSAGGTLFRQSCVGSEKEGVEFALTVTLMVTGVEEQPWSSVTVYVSAYIPADTAVKTGLLIPALFR
jgi:hypothetical protein